MGATVSLASRTDVTVTCFDGNRPTASYDAAIDAGPYKGDTAVAVLRQYLQNTTDPFHAAEQTPSQDPFAGLNDCATDS